MIVIGELINTSRKPINEAVGKRDARYIQDIAKKQADAGANYIDINAGSRLDSEIEDVEWLIKVVETEVDLPICLDSPNPEVLQMGLKNVKKIPMINSISAEKKRLDEMAPLLFEGEFNLVALCLSDSGMPKSTEEVLDNAEIIVKRLCDMGFSRERIYLDPLIQPLSTNTAMGLLAINSIFEMKHKFKDIKTVCGVSNISFGLPKRQLINRLFLPLAMMAGLDAAIIDPTDQKKMTSLLVAELTLGRDDYCLNYLSAFRSGRIVD